jgi:hypothetical protein
MIVEKRAFGVRRGRALALAVAAPLSLMLLPIVGSAPRAGAADLVLDARSLFARGTCENLRLAPSGTAVELDRGVTIEDDGPAAGYSYKPNEDAFGPQVRFLKRLLLDDPRADRALLLIGSAADVRVTLGGRDLPLETRGRTGNVWQIWELPPDRLATGDNDFVLAADKGKIFVARDDEYAAGSTTRTRHPNRSARSSDGGKTWDFDRLGPQGDLDGEYSVRLHLDRFRPRGTLVLPVIDAANLAEGVLSAPVESVGPVRIAANVGTGESTRAVVRVRSGSTLSPGVPQEAWSDWEPLEGTAGALAAPRGRFVQFALELSTSDPLRSPELRGATVSAAPRTGPDWTRDVQVAESTGAALVRTSIPFAYEPFDHPRLAQLRRQHRLDDVVAGAKDEWELLGRLAAWTARQWKPIGHLRDGYPKWDATEILAPHADGTPTGGFCQQFNVTFLQCCQSFGFAGRAVSIGPGDSGLTKVRGGHEVVEIWSNQFARWVHVDGQAAWAFLDGESRRPLGLRELRERQIASLQGRTVPATELVRFAETTHAWTGFDGFPPFLELRLIPRSDFLARSAPLPLNQGMRGWSWTGHHVWSDAAAPASPQYPTTTGHPGTWDWTAGTVRVALEATAVPGTFRVQVDTETPGLKEVLAAIDGAAPRATASGFEWTLHQGTNRLEVRTRNVLGREGPPATIVLRRAT